MYFPFRAKGKSEQIHRTHRRFLSWPFWMALGVSATICLMAGKLFSGQIPASGELSTVHELKTLTPEQSLEHHPFRVKGIVVCYDSGWNQLYVYDGQETAYFNPHDFSPEPIKGQWVEITGVTTGTNGVTNLNVVTLGTAALPDAQRLELPELTNSYGQWIEISGWVRSAEISSGRLALVLQDKDQNCLVYVMGQPGTNNFSELLGCRVRLRGINASKMNGARLDSPLVFGSGFEDIQILEKSDPRSHETPVVYIGSLLNGDPAALTNTRAHINGVVVSYQPGQSLVVKDPTGVIRAQVVQLTRIQPGDRINIWGFPAISATETFLKNAFFEVEQPPSLADVKTSSGQSAPKEKPLTQVAEILKLKREQAARHIPVKLRGVITYADADWHNGFIQDKRDAVYVDLEQKDVRAGQFVELTGVTGAGGFAPEVLNSSIRVLGRTNFPTPVKVNLQDLATGQLDAHWVEMEGVVRRVDAQWGHLNLTLMTPEGRFKVVIPDFNDADSPTNLIDALLSVEGACTSESNVRRQLSGVTLHAPGLDHIKILAAPPSDPFAIEVTPIESVATFDPDRLAGRRVKISGVVTLRIPGQGFILQDTSGGMRVLTRQENELKAGDVVEALGFPVIGDFSPYLEEAIFHVKSQGQLPAARKTTAEQILKQGTNDGLIVTIKARLLQSVPRSANPELVLQDGPIIFTAHLENQSPRMELGALRSGSLLRLTGVCSIQGGEAHEPVAFHLLLRQPNDVELLEAAPWWTTRHTFMVGGGMMAAITAALAWVALLRRQVHTQTDLIRQKLEDEAALEERYRELFENANDMVYTHDLQGRITSINQAGESMLQRPRRQILGKNIIELIVPEQQAAAREWLDQVLRSMEPTASEWDLAAGAGQRVKLEISTRLIESGGELVEVEGIARDITERKRLEREILEISNREQRRIGHDLHDGVCQQLAGIAYMTASLADSLQEKGVSETTQAERIGSLINAVINQTRGVARGLFPVRLEENGLVSALEELAANSSELFKINCRFISEQPPAAVDNGVALHLYYIVLEAVANASKHGKAKNVRITLEPSGDRYLLAVKDDGIGLPTPSPAHTGMGIRIMLYRARVIGATLNLQRGLDSGTQVSCLFLPVSREPSPEAGAKAKTPARNVENMSV